jgi:hypothetical protein
MRGEFETGVPGISKFSPVRCRHSGNIRVWPRHAIELMSMVPFSKLGARDIECNGLANGGGSEEPVDARSPGTTCPTIAAVRWGRLLKTA